MGPHGASRTSSDHVAPSPPGDTMLCTLSIHQHTIAYLRLQCSRQRVHPPIGLYFPASTAVRAHRLCLEHNCEQCCRERPTVLSFCRCPSVSLWLRWILQATTTRHETLKRYAQAFTIIVPYPRSTWATTAFLLAIKRRSNIDVAFRHSLTVRLRLPAPPDATYVPKSRQVMQSPTALPGCCCASDQNISHCHNHPMFSA
jgi:hypothetical protein